MKHVRSILLTGASGLVGRHLLDELKDDYRIFAIARRSQQECGAPIHPNIAWIRADIADNYVIDQAFREVASAGGVDVVLHLAAYYDFTSARHPEYYRSNVCGMRNVLTLAKELAPKRFVFTSSVAACSFPAPGLQIDENSPPDGDHVYSWSKRVGEELVMEEKNTLPSCIVRLGAVFTDWCEYAPLYVFLKTWLGSSWRSRILAGKGESAIPYIHIRDVVRCLRTVIEQAETLPPKVVLHACTPGATSHKQLYKLATHYYLGQEKRPIYFPVALCKFGLIAVQALARLTGGEKPFEQPWMLRYADRCLDVNVDRTHELLSWSPKARHLIERRIPYMLERMRSEPMAWQLRNARAMSRNPDRPGFRLYTALSTLEYSICDDVVSAIHAPSNTEKFALMAASPKDETVWYVRLLYRLLLSSVHAVNKMILQNYFEMFTDVKRRTPAYARETVATLELMNERIHETARNNEVLRSLGEELQHSVALPIEFAIDEVLSWQDAPEKTEAVPDVAEASPELDERLRVRSQLEETIWKCLVMRTWDEP